MIELAWLGLGAACGMVISAVLTMNRTDADEELIDHIELTDSVVLKVDDVWTVARPGRVTKDRSLRAALIQAASDEDGKTN